MSIKLKRLSSYNHLEARDVYVDAIQSQSDSLYSQEQITAWSELAWLPGVLDRPLSEGMGWAVVEDEKIVAFASRHPSNRLALLYCRGCHGRQGYATALIDRVEKDAVEAGEDQLITEASLFSYSLLMRCGWILKDTEKIQIGGVDFERYLMAKKIVESK